MAEISFAGRPFQLWRYTVGHRQLQLRSTRSEAHPTRVDILFVNVKGMRLATSFCSLQIFDAAGEERAAIITEFGRELSDNEHAFAVRADDCDGWVIAGNVTSHEDEGAYNDPSPLDVFPSPPDAGALGPANPDTTE